MTLSKEHPSYLELTSLERTLTAAAAQIHGQRLLDIGCGNRPYAALFPTVQYYVGLDLPGPYPLARQVDVWGTALCLPFPSSFFDVVLCTQVLEHVTDPLQLLREAARVLSPGGQLLLTAPQTWGLHEEPHDYYRFTRYGLLHLLTQAGFEVSWLTARGGVVAMLGQTILTSIYTRYPRWPIPWHWRLFNRALNASCAWVDRLWYWDKDTLGYTVLGIRRSPTP